MTNEKNRNKVCRIYIIAANFDEPQKNEIYFLNSSQKQMYMRRSEEEEKGTKNKL